MQTDRWDGETHAVRHLLKNFYITFGTIQAKAGHVVDDDDQSAIDYLIQEWDYAYFETQGH